MTVVQPTPTNTDFSNWITTPKDLAQVAKKIAQEKVIAFDTEFIRETTFYPRLEILQLATRDEVWLIDVQAFSEKGKVRLKDFKPIIQILTDPKILKIVHAAHGDQECILSALGVLATPIFDTAVGASLCGMGDNIGLGNLLKATVKVELSKGYARTNWSKRPLPKPVLEYAALDVKYLIQVADLLFERLDESKRKQWALDLSEKFSDVNLYEVPPEDITKRLAQSGKFNIKDYGVLLELVRWRETRVRELNVPRRWLADDGVLIDLAKTKPTTEEQLQGFRGLSKGEHKPALAKRILQAVAEGVSGKNEIPPEIKKKSSHHTSNEESRALELLRCELTWLSDQYQIALKHLVAPAQVLPLLRLSPKTIEDLEQSGLVSNQLGRDGVQALFDFLNGQVALTLVNGKIKRVKA